MLTEANRFKMAVRAGLHGQLPSWITVSITWSDVERMEVIAV